MTPLPDGAEPGERPRRSGPPTASPALIAILAPDLPEDLLADVQREVRARGWSCDASRGREQTVLAVAGPSSKDELDELLAARVDADVLALGTRRDYEVRARRRRLLHGLVGGLAALATLGLVLPALGFLRSPAETQSLRGLVRLGEVDAVPPDGARLFRLGDERLYVVRLGTDRFYALSARCTNAEGCQLEWSPERLQLVCPCDGGVFDVHGNVVEGQPYAPLPSYPVEPIRGDLHAQVR